MDRSSSEAGISSSSPFPVPGSGPVMLSGSPDGAPSSLALPVPQQGSLGRTWLLAASIALAVLGVAAFAALAAGAGHGRMFAGTGAAIVLLLAGVLFVMRRWHAHAAAAAALWEQRAKQALEHAAEQQQRAVSWEQRAVQAQKRAEELAHRAGEQGERARTVMAGLAKAADHLLYVYLPAVLEGSAAPPPFSANGADSDEAAVLFARVGAAVEQGVAKLREQVNELRRLSDNHSESSRRAVLTLARLLQASALRIQVQAAKMAEDRPADPGVLEASMRVEHAAAQMARNAQSLVVLCGEWPGQQWPDPLALPDVVRAAAGRIMSYKRVNVSGDHGVAADASVVEPLIHLVAELLANATQSSPPTTQVEVTVQAVQHGAVIEIDDRGIGMEEAQFRQAREILSGSRLVGLGDLGEFPQTGLAVIGHYVDRHGFGVELRRSPYGGVRAVVLVPDPLVVNNLEPYPAARPVPTAPLQPPPAQGGIHELGAATPGRRLPRRQSLRGQALPGLPPAGPAALAGESTPEQEGDFLAAYLSAGDAAAIADADEQDTDFSDRTER
jgi:signal transduction histidine kinase